MVPEADRMSRHRALIRQSALLAAVALAKGCGDGTTPTVPPKPDPPRAATVIISPATAELTALGATAQLTGQVLDQSGQVMASATVTWSSSNVAVATVGTTGLVTAVGNGTATVTATSGGVSGMASVTVAQEVGAVAISPGTGTLIMGDTLRLEAAATDANGHVVPGAEFAWASSDTMVAAVDDAGLVTGIASGEAEVTATAGGMTGRAALTVVDPRPPPGPAPEGAVLPGTVWESADVITPSDPSVLDSVVYTGRGMRGFFDPFEDARRWRDDLVLFLFEAHYSGGATMEVQAHPAYGEADSALAAAKLFVAPIGRLPRVLINGGREVELSPTPTGGAGGTGCGKIYHWQGDLRRPDVWKADFVEEIALHEGSHAVLEDCGWEGCRIDCAGLGGSRSAQWRAAQAADSVFISAFARAHPDREDMAETLWAWFVSRCVPDRLHPEYKRRIDAGIPHRLAYFDRLGLDMRPWPC